MCTFRWSAPRNRWSADLERGGVDAEVRREVRALVELVGRSEAAR